MYNREDFPSTIAKASIYKHWTIGSYLCWKNNCVCNNCTEKRICDSIKPMAIIPYGMKPMKFATLKLKEKFGTEGLDEQFGHYFKG